MLSITSGNSCNVANDHPLRASPEKMAGTLAEVSLSLTFISDRQISIR
jgi:hypothetical protein